MGTCPEVETERLLMRPFREADVDAYRAVLATPQVSASLHLPAAISREYAWQQVASYLGQWELRNHGQWALEEKASGRFVGRAGAHRPERDDWPGIEIGWTLHPDFWRKGYATEAGRAAIEWVFANHGVDAVFSMILPENRPSQAVARRLGFSLVEERVFAFFPAKPHGLWRLARADYVRAT
jgi:RimJ/RimL family protein N-acetyltransferase